MLAEKNGYLDSAYQQLQIISQDTEKRLEYEARQKAILDYNQGILEAEQRGKKMGIEEGQEQMAIKIARNLLESGFSAEAVAKNTGLSVSQIEHLKEKT